MYSFGMTLLQMLENCSLIEARFLLTALTCPESVVGTRSLCRSSHDIERSACLHRAIAAVPYHPWLADELVERHWSRSVGTLPKP